MRMNGGVVMGLKERMEKKALERAARLEEEERLMRESAVEAEYNEKGQIKRSGFRMGRQVNYGQEFEEETMDKVFKPAIVFLVVFFLLFIGAGIVFFFLIRSGNFEPFLFKIFSGM